MRRLIHAACLASFALAAAEPSRAQVPVAVLVDGSGSMRGFFQTGSLAAAVESLQEAGADRRWSFTYSRTPDGVLRGGLRPYSPAPTEYGNETPLWRGLSEYLPQARAGEMIAVVTDNLQDSGGVDDADMREFYQRLPRIPGIEEIHVLPLQLQFDGNLLRRDGRTVLSDYSGPRGLVVYVLALHGSSPEARRTWLRRVSAALGSSAIRMWPYVTAPVRAVVDTAAHPRQTGGRCRNVPRLVPEHGNDTTLISRDTAPAGRPFGGAFVVKLHSELEGVSLRKPGVRAEVTQRFGMSDFDVPGRPEALTSPTVLETDFDPGDSTAITVSICFPDGLRFNAFGRDFWRLAFNPSSAGRYEGKVQLRLETPHDSLALAEAVRSRYSTVDPDFFERADPDLQGRVWGLEYAFRNLVPDSVMVAAPVDYHVRFQAAYPLTPFFLLVLGGVALILLALAAGRWVLGARTYVLTEEGPGRFRLAAPRGGTRRRPRGHGAAGVYDPAQGGPSGNGAAPPGSVSSRTLRLSPLGASYPLRVEGAVAAAIRYLPLRGPRVAARAGYLVDGHPRKVLPPGESTFEVALAGLSSSVLPGPGARSPGKGPRRRQGTPASPGDLP